ncbi:MAG TPA: efflux RND transporter periplasmic adaptor subunit [Candidatus Binataceae bacterium]|nr:efflux RND transporter periplasmic adaptor subunit [Candidatus Binataceae bacterium]
MTLRIQLLLSFLAAALTAPVSLPAANQPGAPSTVTLSSNSEAEHQIKVVTIGKKPLGALISATAMIEPDPRNVARVTPRIRARVVRLIADPGQRVKPGQPLAILSSVELGQAKAEYLKARSLSDIAHQHMTREQSLYQRKVASMKDALEARAAYDTAFAQYQAARETLSLLIPPAEVARVGWSTAGRSLSDFALTSPIAGTLVRRDLIVGQMVTGDAEVITVMNLDRVWVLANVFEHDLAGLTVGDAAQIKVEAWPDRSFEGVVSYLSDTVDPATRTVQARIDVPNPGHRLKPGMFASAEIQTDANARQVLAAPTSAIYDVNGAKAVFVQTKPHVFSLRPVQVGAAGHERVEILSGVSSGEQVVIHGGLLLKALLVNTGD